MGHKHSVYDSDAHFSINPITKVIKNESSKKTTLVQGDHNSERFSFDIPRHIEGHDMMQCNLVEVHYDNKETGTDKISSDFYEVKDMQISPDDEEKVVFSWLIIDTATKYAGSLEFSITFKCMTGDVCDYKWNTGINTDISVSPGKDNSGVVVERAPNVVDQWRSEIFGDAENAVANINLAEKEALEAVQAESEDQLEQIQVAGENIVNAATIAEQNAKNVLANAIKGHLKGEVVTADDVSAVEHEMIVKAMNKNMIGPFKETKEFIRDGVTLSVEKDGQTIRLNGTCGVVAGGRNVFNEIATPILLEKGKTYTLSSEMVSGVTDGTYAIYINSFGEYEAIASATNADDGRTKTFVPNKTVECFVGVNIAVNTTYEDVVIRYQLEEGTTATDYTPYVDPATVKVRRCGKNLFDITNLIGKVNTVNGVTAQVMEDGCVHVSGSPIDTSVSTTIDLSHNKDTQKFPKGTYVYSNNAIRANENILCFPQANNSTTGSWLANFLPTGGEISTEFSIRHIVVFIKQGVTGDVSSKFYLQVESGNNATEFEPFKDISTHTPSSDGTVSGMMSTAPNMTILTDKEGVVIDCEYIVDTKTYIDKKFAELQAALAQ